MDNFTFYSPTKFVFGKGEENNVGALCKARGAKKVMIVYGGGSVVRSGLLDRVKASLQKEGIAYCEHGGVKPNPRFEHMCEGADLARKEGVDLLLAVGGGSCIDEAKGIGIAALYDGDPWDFFCGKKVADVCIPVGCVLTIAAAGSEGSDGCVITREDMKFKGGPAKVPDLFRPVFSIMNPELTYTLPAYQTGCGVTDIFVHVVERYFTNTPDGYLIDNLCESVFRTMIKYGPKAIENPEDYNARAQIMWGGMIAHNNTCGVGRVQDWGSHGLQAPIGALYDSAHGAGLATMCPAWMKYVYKHDVARFVQYATRVWGVDNDVYDPEGVALEGIARTKAFFKSLGMPVTLSELGVKDEDLDFLCDRTTGNFVKLQKDDIRAIYELAR